MPMPDLPKAPPIRRVTLGQARRQIRKDLASDFYFHGIAKTWGNPAWKNHIGAICDSITQCRDIRDSSDATDEEEKEKIELKNGAFLRDKWPSIREYFVTQRISEIEPCEIEFPWTKPETKAIYFREKFLKSLEEQVKLKEELIKIHSEYRDLLKAIEEMHEDQGIDNKNSA
jgi:hypothetical protein